MQELLVSQTTTKPALRQMVRATLMGSHVHRTADGQTVNIWQRGKTYLARGRWRGVSFGETLGHEPLKATARLRKLLGEIEDGTYIRPSEQARQQVARKQPRLTIRELVNAFLMSKRSERGRQTARNYRARLRPLVEFSEQQPQLARWPLAATVDVEFVAEYKSFLLTSSKNRTGSSVKTSTRSASYIRHCLESLRGAIRWALDPLVSKLPAQFLNPLTKQQMPTKLCKDPLRVQKITPERCLPLIAVMDRWQLCQLAWSFVLPLRPDEAVGLLLSDVNLERGWLEFGHRFTDCNFTKGKTAFVLPYPPAFTPILKACLRGRVAGPLLLGRRAFESMTPPALASDLEIREQFEQRADHTEPGSLRTEQDRKLLFRSELQRRWGGASKDRLASEFKDLVTSVFGSTPLRFYDLRHMVTQGMKDSGMPHLELRYLTGHSSRDILHDYASLRPTEAMTRYFDRVKILIDAISQRVKELGLHSTLGLHETASKETLSAI